MSRDLILQEIRGSKSIAISLPEIDLRQFSARPNLQDTFFRNVEAVRGKCICVCDQKEIPDNIRQLFPDAKEIVSHVGGIDIGTMDMKQISGAQELDKLDLAIVSGQFGVAENGAVWISDRNFDHRSIPFIASHLAIVLNQEDIVENMHEACARMARFDEGYGVFVAGPSKTADIEQSLVIGAQGPMSLTIFVVNRHSES